MTCSANVSVFARSQCQKVRSSGSVVDSDGLIDLYMHHRKANAEGTLIRGINAVTVWK